MKGTRSLLIPNLVLKFPRKWPKSIWNNWKKGRRNWFQNSTAPPSYCIRKIRTIAFWEGENCPVPWHSLGEVAMFTCQNILYCNGEVPASSGLGIAEKTNVFLMLSYPSSAVWSPRQHVKIRSVLKLLPNVTSSGTASPPKNQTNNYKASEAFSSPVQWWEGRSQHSHVPFAELL